MQGLIFIPIAIVLGIITRRFVMRRKGNQAIEHTMVKDLKTNREFNLKLLEYFKKYYGKEVVDVVPVHDGLGDVDRQISWDCIVRFENGCQSYKTVKLQDLRKKGVM